MKSREIGEHLRVVVRLHHVDALLLRLDIHVGKAPQLAIGQRELLRFFQADTVHTRRAIRGRGETCRLVYGPAAPLPAMAPICPASRYLEDWVAIHLEEIMTRCDPDLVWVDGDWGGDGQCFCSRRRKLARKRFGEGAINRVEYHLWIRNEYRRKIATVLHKYKPACLYSAGATTPAIDSGLANHMDWQSGDWFRCNFHRIMQSIAMRRYTTLGLPYDAMTCDTQYIPDFNARSRHKSLDCLLQEGAGVAAGINGSSDNPSVR